MSVEEMAVGPDCREGKHRACDGRGFDLVADVVIECGCPCHAGEEVTVEQAMVEAVAGMREHARAAATVDRRGWTKQQWALDAERLMGDADGSVSSLVNGHVTGLIAEWRRTAGLAELAGIALDEQTRLAEVAGRQRDAALELLADVGLKSRADAIREGRA